MLGGNNSKIISVLKWLNVKEKAGSRTEIYGERTILFFFFTSLNSNPGQSE